MFPIIQIQKHIFYLRNPKKAFHLFSPRSLVASLCAILDIALKCTHLASQSYSFSLLHSPSTSHLCPYVQNDVEHNRHERQHQKNRNQLQLMLGVSWWPPAAHQRRPASITSRSQLTLFLLDDGTHFLDGQVVTLLDGGLDDLFDVRV